MARIIWGQVTDRGLIRSVNEDALFACNMVSQTEHPISIGLFILADGLGGGMAGMFASRLAVNITSSYLMSFIAALVAVPQNDISILEAVSRVIHEANLQIIQQATHDPELRGAGSTLDVVLLIKNVAYISHVGDSRVYSVTKTDCKQLTEDHNIEASLIRAGAITYEQTKNINIAGPGRLPYRLLGMSMNLEIDTSTYTLDSGSYLLLCSDGLLRDAPEENKLATPITEIIRNTPDPQVACEKLIEYANTQGGEDNTTLILVKVED